MKRDTVLWFGNGKEERQGGEERALAAHFNLNRMQPFEKLILKEAQHKYLLT